MITVLDLELLDLIITLHLYYDNAFFCGYCMESCLCVVCEHKVHFSFIVLPVNDYVSLSCCMNRNPICAVVGKADNTSIQQY